MKYRFPQRVEIRYRIWVIGLAMAALCCLALMVGLGLLPFAFKRGGMALLLVSALQILFLASIWQCARVMLRTEPAVVVDRFGVEINTGSGFKGRVMWREIKGVRGFAVSNGSFIAIIVKSPERYIRKGWFGYRLMRIIEKVFFHSPVHINASTLTIRDQDLIRLLKDYLKHWREAELEMESEVVPTKETGLRWCD